MQKASNDDNEDHADQIAEALELSERALEILDSIPGMPGDIGAHLDLAINRLQDFASPKKPSPWANETS